MEVHVRKAKREEYEIVERMLRQVHEIHVNLRPDIYRNCENLLTEGAFKQALREEKVFVADLGGEAAGIMFLEYRHTERKNQNIRNAIYIETIVVDKKYRGMNVGRTLLDHAVKIKERKGFDSVELQVNAKNCDAYEFYKHYGFSEKSVNMELL